MHYFSGFGDVNLLILITSPGISLGIISTFWRRKLRHRNLPKVIQQYDFRAHVLNFYAEMSECSNFLEEGLEEGEIKYNQEADGTIGQNLDVKKCWVLCAYVTSTSLICCELFKGGDTEITDSFQNVAHVRSHRHQPQN